MRAQSGLDELLAVRVELLADDLRDLRDVELDLERGVADDDRQLRELLAEAGRRWRWPRDRVAGDLPGRARGIVVRAEAHGQLAALGPEVVHHQIVARRRDPEERAEDRVGARGDHLARRQLREPLRPRLPGSRAREHRVDAGLRAGEHEAIAPGDVELAELSDVEHRMLAIAFDRDVHALFSAPGMHASSSARGRLPSRTITVSSREASSSANDPTTRLASVMKHGT